VLPDPPDLKFIGNKDLPEEKQKFYVTPLPKDILRWDRKSREEFEDKEFEKRYNGYWFWNKGNLEWTTGTNYFYINWYHIDIGLPSFVDSDRDWFYMWWYTQNNPKAKGFVNLENRRGGKSWKGGCSVFEATSNPKYENKISTIQSKTDEDAKKIFKRIVFSWKKLPYFFKPIDTGVSNPSSSLDFSEPSVRNTKSQEKDYRTVLNSVVDYAPSGEEALDGTKQFVSYQDEIGKSKKINVNKRIQIVAECVVDGSDIIGKIIATSTVEEMDKGGGRNCKEIWDGADPNKLLDNGETQNGLLRYFKSSDYGYRGKDNDGVPFIDEYGYSDRERTKKFIEAKLNSLVKREDKNSYKRKYPLYIRDCWISDTKKPIYDAEKIEQQIEYNETLSNVLVKGNFYWIGGIQYGAVGWNPDENGKWLVSWLPPTDLRNKTITKNGKKAPGNIDYSCAGLDPYDNNTTVSGDHSNAAAYVFRKFDPLNPYETGTFVCEYVNRPNKSEIMFEDMIMQSVFYGHEILIESNKIGCINYFLSKGYDNYLMRRPEETQTNSSRKMVEDYGIPMSGVESRQSLVYATESYIINKVGLIQEEGVTPYMGRCPFDKLLQTWLDYDVDDDWTKYDSMVGAGLALLASRKLVQKKKEIKNFNLFPQYKMNGDVSQRI